MMRNDGSSLPPLRLLALGEKMVSFGNEEKAEQDQKEAAGEKYALQDRRTDVPPSHMNTVGDEAVPYKIGAYVSGKEGDHTGRPEAFGEHHITQTDSQPPYEPVRI